MSSKKIVEVNLLNSDEANKFVGIFADMLYTDKINCKGDYLVVETLDKIYKVPFSLFYVNIIEAFEDIFREYYSVKKILNTPDLLFGVTNSIFEKIKIEEREKLLVNLKEKILNDEEFANTLKERIFTILSREKNFNLRKLWINRIEEFGILDVEDKVVLSYYSNLSPEELKKLFDEGIIADNQKLTVVMDACKYKRLEEKKVAKKRANSGVINIINTLLSSDYIVKLYTYFDEIKEENEINFREFIRDDEFIRSKVKKEDILNVDFETLTVFLRDKNPKMPNSLKITSKDLINQYGKLFDGQQIYKLAVYGFIDSQVLIEVYEINEALKYINYDGRILENDELDEFYSPKALIGMKLNGDISPKFAQSYVEMQDFENNKEKFKEKSESLIENLRILTGDKKSQEFQENLLFFFKIGFCDLENTKQNISEEYIENKISNNEMKIEEVFELYIPIALKVAGPAIPSTVNPLLL